MSDFLPQEIILQILHKLPIKSLVSCTCVCKTWHSLIKNPSFISTHLTLTISSNTHLLLFRRCFKKSEHYSVHLDNQQLSTYMQLDFPFKRYNPNFRVVGSFNGIICIVDDLSESYYNTLILWNPLIRKCLTIPKPTYGSYDGFTFFGFGFDSKTNDYKVLKYGQFLDEEVFGHDYDDDEVEVEEEEEEEEEGEEEASSEVELYSLNTNSWKSITCIAPKYQFYMHDIYAFVNGVVHWVVNMTRRDGLLRNLVLGFSMGDEVFLEIELPKSLVGGIPYELSITKYGDSSIAVIRTDLYSQCDLWVMKEYGVVESWTKLLSLERQG